MTDARLKTRHTLLLRLREPEDARAWREFTDLYQPLLEKFARLRGVAGGMSNSVANLGHVMPVQFDNNAVELMAGDP